MHDLDILMEVLEQLGQSSKTLATAESCTGGMVAQMLTAVPNSSLVFWGGTVVYSNDAKVKLLGVSTETLALYGAVSAETAREMAWGMLKLAGTDYAVAITGIAGPGGGTAEKPLGLVYVAVAANDYIEVRECHFSGERGDIRRQSAAAALTAVRRALAAT